jgi:hypothetical protein
MVKTSKDERLVIRMPTELREWIDTQAEEIGLDAAAWVRMRLTQQMRGKAVGDLGREGQSVDWAISRVIRKVDADPAPPLDPAALDALIDEGLAAADEQGLTTPVESTDDPAQSETMRLGEPSRATMRNLVGNGSVRPW